MDSTRLGHYVGCSGKPWCNFFEDASCECGCGDNWKDEDVGSAIVHQVETLEMRLQTHVVAGWRSLCAREQEATVKGVRYLYKDT